VANRTLMPYVLATALVAALTSACDGDPAPSGPSSAPPSVTSSAASPGASGAPAVAGFSPRATGTPLAWLPDGTLVTSATVGEGDSPTPRCLPTQQRYTLRRYGPGATGQVVTDDPWIFAPALSRLSPDGARLAVLGICEPLFLGEVAVVPLGGGPVQPLPFGKDRFYGSTGAANTLGWLSPTELLVLRMTIVGGRNGPRVEAVAVDVTSMRERVVFAGKDLQNARPLTGGRIVALSGSGPALDVEVVATDGRRRPLGKAVDAEPSPDGSRVAAWDAYASSVRLLPLSGGAAVPVTLEGEVVGVQWSPDSRRLLVVTAPPDEGNRPRVYVVDADGAARVLKLPSYRKGALVWSADGTRVAYEAGEIVRDVAV